MDKTNKNTADFALEQMRPLEQRVAELERRLAVARDLLNDYHTLLAHIRNSPIGSVGDHSIYTTQHNASRIEKQIAQVANAIRGEAADPDHIEKPLNMVLHCPSCGQQHVDAPEPDKCGCGHARQVHKLGDGCCLWAEVIPHRDGGCDCLGFAAARAG